MAVEKFIGVLDYGCGNIGSVIKMLDHIGVSHQIISDGANMAQADALLLPGVGHFQTGMALLKDKDMIAPLRAFVAAKKPLLGICLGMQLLTQSSEEGGKGLGFIDALTVKFPETTTQDDRLLVPHIGWNFITQSADSDLITKGDRFYFVHSYYVDAAGSASELAAAHYGGHSFSAAIAQDNVTGVQFHPEKSHHYGLGFLTSYFKKVGLL